ncbi:MAG TPA: hypothetical protein VFI47_29670 [Acidimicrobiales bacterium]|nr:hypothetical protein [Acidimicrobiales bacterium]
MPGPLPQVAGLVVAAAAAATAAAGGGAPPPLPGDGAVSAAAGRRLVLDATAPAHPLAVGRASATFRGDGQALVQVAWIDPAALDALRSPHDGQPLTVPGLGDEAVRARVGGGLIARRGDRAVLVVAHLPDLDEAGRDAVTATVAGAALSALG